MMVSSDNQAPWRCLVWTTMALCMVSSLLAREPLNVYPKSVQLQGPESSAQILVADEQQLDVTDEASYRIQDPTIATVNQHGHLQALREGQTKLVIQANQSKVVVPVQVTGIENPRLISFRNEVIPILTKAGCNSGGCHGKAEGQNGFKLSVFGFDPVADHDALTKESRGRRITPATPAHSLLLLKATGTMPHGGGRQIEEDSAGYQRILRWIREGAALDSGETSTITKIDVQPSERLLPLRGKQRLRVIATDSSGRTRDVTSEAQYESNALSIATVEEDGLIRGGEHPGEAAILVRYMNKVAICRINMPRPGVEFSRPSETNFIDGLVWDKLERMGIQPSGRCDDATFVRRVYLDTIGTLPTAEEARAFLESNQPNKREVLVDQLLDRREYSLYWSLLWADLMRVDANALGAESSVAMTRWLRKQFEQNRPYDEMVREILTARGSVHAESPAPLYLTLDKPIEQASGISQLFLGVRIECAQCHHHPFERWSQRDFYGFAGFFTGTKRKKLPDGTSAIITQSGNDLKHPRTGEVVPAAGLGAEPPVLDDAADRRVALADWMTVDTNPFFARAIVNRLWAHYFGRGLVDPVDDLRATNPATNEALLDALAAHLREVDYDLKAFTKTLLRSQVYQRSSQTNATNVEDDQNFSHASYRSLPAEVLLDAISQVTGVPEKFNGWPVGARAIEVWDNRMPSYFFRIFGRPSRTTVCACERGDAPTIAQALHLMNSPELGQKIRHRHGRARQLAAADLTDQEVIEAIYLTTLSRPPTKAELETMLELFQAGIERRTAIEDLLWTLMNTKEFLFNH